MPWLPLLTPALPTFALGLLGMLLAIGVSYLLEAVANALPNVGIPFTHVTFRNIFKSVIDPVRVALLGVFIGLFRFVEGWFRAPAYNAMNGAAKSIAATWHHATQLDYLWGHAIPNSARAAVNTAAAHSDYQLQLVRTEIHAAQVKWEHAHSYADAVRYIDLERTAPSVEHAYLAGHARTLIASENHAQDLHDQLRDYIGRHITGQADVALPYNGQTLTGVAGAITIPRGIDLGSTDVQDIIKTGSRIAVGTAVAIIAEKIVQCLVSRCAGNNNFDNLLKDALGIVSAVEFATFVNDVVHNPAGVAAGFESDVQRFVPAVTHAPDDIWRAIEGALGL